MISANEIRGNSIVPCDGITYGGAGVYVRNVVGALINGNRIIGNSASASDQGGGILLAGTNSLMITNNLISDNVALYGGGIFMNSGGSSAFNRIEQNLIVGNRAVAGGGIAAGMGDTDRINNNTIVNNDAAEGSGVSLSISFGQGSVKNNIVVARQSQTAVDCNISPFVSPQFFFNNVTSPQGSAYGPSCNVQNLTGNISAAPDFVNAEAGNYQLRLGSPSIDTGTNLLHALPATDFNGDPRIKDGNGDGMAVIDMGAFEYNGRPIAAAGQDQTVACGSDCRGNVTLDGGGSYDPDGGQLTFQWTGLFGTASGATPLVSLPKGEHTINLTVTDPSGYSATDSVVVTVVDTTPPTITAVTASPSVLLQANHQMVPVTVAVSATDNCDPSVICRIVSVASNEPVDGLGDGDTSPDWVVTGNLTLDLRAERSGKGTGRVYTITVECTDLSGNKSTSTVAVSVPRNN